MRRERPAASVEPPAADAPPRARVLRGEAIDVLAGLPAASVQVCVTSPPYWGIRDFGVPPRVWGGDRGCRHRWEALGGRVPSEVCGPCGAWRGCLGLEPDPGLFVRNLVSVMREVRRVLRPDGTLWLNLGDSYATRPIRFGEDLPGSTAPADARPKDLLGIPWRVALALQAGGWWLRSDVIWAKANPTPEPYRDRPALTHEHVFLLSPSRRYHYDGFAAREQGRDGLRNRRTVWALPTAQFPGSHFATFPEALVEPCVLAGSSPAACRRCGAPWRRCLAVERRLPDGREAVGDWTGGAPPLRAGRAFRRGEGRSRVEIRRDTVGWEPSCHHREPGARCTVLDPFAGTGTTGRVAVRHGRDFVGVELSREYARIARRRIGELRSGQADQ
jgi:DNA modification methylase